MSFWRSKRGILTLGVFVVLALFLVRPGANRLRARIVNSISLALGRPVDVAAVKVRLLPAPGFDLEDFVVHDDPAFGAEPMLRARAVTASLRLTSLLRGRLEIARLSLTEPSLNLVSAQLRSRSRPQARRRRKGVRDFPILRLTAGASISSSDRRKNLTH